LRSNVFEGIERALLQSLNGFPAQSLALTAQFGSVGGVHVFYAIGKPVQWNVSGCKGPSPGQLVAGSGGWE